jgi:acyl-CoA dehydrogenase
MEETDEVPMDLIKRMGELGFASLLIPREYAEGIPYAGMGHVARMIVLEEIGRISPAIAQTLQIHHLGQAPIIYFGNEEQKRRWLPALARGEKIAGLAMTEPYGGSDPVGAIRTTAKREGDEYVLNGMKVWITNSHIADVMGVVARTGEGSKGLSTFIVEKDMEGFSLGKVNKEFGLKGCNVGEIILKNCKVPKENMIGAEGDGLKIGLHAVSNVGRPGVAATALGIVRRCLEEGARYAERRTLYGKPIAELQAIQWHLTDMYMNYEAGRWLTYHAAWLRDQGERADAENAAAKFWATEAAVQCARKLIDIYGA